MENTPVAIAVIASLQVLLLTIVQATLLARKERRDAELKSKEKTEDYKRQDEVAARVALAAQQAADAATLLLKAQHDTIARTDEVARLAAEVNDRVEQKLGESLEQGKKIHILVNSDMTAARTNERDQAILTLTALKHVRALSEKLGLPAQEDEVKLINDQEKRIQTLNAILADRLAAQKRVEAEDPQTSQSPPD